jgi:hypothetical protein
LATADRETTDREPEVPRSSASPALPNARLNPLLNPLLAKQLGRWAHIYYTASVDKREAAIEKLVCELEAEEARLAGTGSSAGPREASPQGPVAPRTVGPVLVTAPMDAASQEPPVVEISRIANSSGAALFAEQSKRERPMSEQPRFEQPALESEVMERRTGEPESMPSLRPRPEIEEPVETVPETVPESWQELLRRTGSAPPGAAPENRWQPPYVREAELTPDPHPDEGSYVSRDAIPYAHSFDDLLAKSGQIELLQPSTGSWRRPLIAVVVLAVLGGSLWMIQRRRVPPGAAEQARKPQAPAVQQPAATPPVAQPASAQPAAASPSAAAPAQASAQSPQTSKVSQPSTAAHETPKAPNVGSPNNSATVAHGPSPQAPLSADATPPSDPDLVAGMRALQGPQRNSADAARHLWQSVKNQNSLALILLAGLYAKGDGVSQDCDQAKILLDAATRQAKSHTQFIRVEMMRADLRNSGCE